MRNEKFAKAAIIAATFSASAAGLFLLNHFNQELVVEHTPSTHVAEPTQVTQQTPVATPGNTTHLAHAQNDIAQIRHELGSLRDAVERLIKHQSDTAAQVEELQTSEQSLAMATPAPTSETIEDPNSMATKMEHTQLLLQEQLYSETMDEEWANETLDIVQQNFQHEELADFELVAASCGATLCQLNLAIDKSLPIEESMQKLSVHRAWEGQTFFRADADGNTTLFFARSGHELPNADAMN